MSSRLLSMLLTLLLLNAACMVAISHRIRALQHARVAAERALQTHDQLLLTHPDYSSTK